MAPQLSRALVSRQASGRSGAYGAALLDVAQDHLLWLLAEEALFDHGRLIFKGGTSLRKCRLGNSGRFSTDLDFTAPNDDDVLAACEGDERRGDRRVHVRARRGEQRRTPLATPRDTQRPRAPDVDAVVESPVDRWHVRRSDSGSSRARSTRHTKSSYLNCP